MNVPVWPFIAQAILVVIGWAVLFVNSNRIASRGETRKILDRTCDLILTAERSACAAWQEVAEGDTGGLALKVDTISQSIDIVEEYMQLLQRRRMDVDYTAQLTDFRDVLTLDIEQAANLTPAQISKAKARIARKSKNVIISLERAFQNLHG